MSTSSLLSGLRVLYQVIAQTINTDNSILDTLPAELSISLPDGVVGKSVYSVPDGAVDMPMCLITEDQPVGQQFIDYVLLITDKEISFKLQGAGSTPIVVRAGGVALLDSKNITSMLVSNASGSKARVLFQQARWQPLP